MPPLPDYYKILGVKKSATSAEIKKAYRNLTKQHHPDQGGDDRQFRLVQEAYDVIGTKKSRDSYDAERKEKGTANTDLTVMKKRGTAAPRQPVRRHKLIGAAWITVGLILLAYLAFGLYLYLAGPSGGFARAVTAVFPYPAATITVPGFAGSFVAGVVASVVFGLSLLWLISLLVSRARDAKRLVIAGALVVVSAVALVFIPSIFTATTGYHAFLSRVAALETFQEKRKAAAGQQPGQPQQADASKEELQAEALKQLTLNDVIRQEADKYDIKVTRKEVNETYRQYAERSQGEENLRKQLKEYLGWSPAEFKQEMKIKLMQEKLNTKLSSDDKLNEGAKQKAEGILAQVKSGTDFAELAKKSDDPTAQSGGDQGFVKKGELEPALEQAAFSTEQGKTSEIIKSQRGYVILKVEEKQADQVRVRQILVKTTSLAEYIPQELKEARVNIFVKDLLWNKELSTVESKKKPDIQPPAEGSPAPGAAAPAGSPVPDQGAPASPAAAAPAAQ